MSEHFCGCCGAELTPNEGQFWCRRCRKHIVHFPKANGLPPWDRTYFAQRGDPCPYEEAS
jgi:hypothetical protein